MLLSEYFPVIKKSKSDNKKYDFIPGLFNKYSYNKVLEELYPHLRENHSRLSCCLSDTGEEGVYSNFNNIKWTTLVKSIKEKIEEMLNLKFIYCAVQYYKDGDSCIVWHNDKEAMYTEVVSVSFGEARIFGIRKDKEVKKLLLNHGDCLIMKVGFQSEYEHSILKEKGVKGSRLSLTFRR